MSIAALPPIPAPPHDPTSLLADRRVGWALLEATDVVLDTGRLTLAPSPGSLRALTEPSGSFGGLRPPANAAWFAGDVWLVDQTSGQLLRFDPCSCAFEAVPCFGGAGSEPRQIGDVGGIAVAHRRLYVSDTVNARVAVFVLPSMGLAGLWQPPAPWRPRGIAVGRGGRVHVVDDLNGAVHTFTNSGTYVGSHSGVGASTHVLVAHDGATLYLSGDVDAFRIAPDGHVTKLDGVRTADIAGEVERPPFVVDRDGAMHLGSLCSPPAGSRFGGRGQLLGAPGAEPPRYQRSGMALLGPFDSFIDGCVWHRVILRGELPACASVLVSTQTSDVELPVSQLVDRPVETNLRSTSFDDGEWEGLIMGVPGRHLWLRLEMAGSGEVSPVIQQVELELPRISLRRYMPAVYAQEPRSADFTDRFLAIFDRELARRGARRRHGGVPVRPAVDASAGVAGVVDR